MKKIAPLPPVSILVAAAALTAGACLLTGTASVRADGTPPVRPPVAASGRHAYGPWRSSKIGGGGYVQNVVLCPTNPRRLYAYVDVGGVYRSDDGGRRWRMMNRTLPKLATRSLLVDPRNADRLLAATGDQWEGNKSGLFESRDGGETWKKVSDTFFYGNESYRAAGVVLARDPKNPDIVLAAAGPDGVLRSTDGGTTWTKTGGAAGTFPTDLKWDRRGGAVFLCARPEKVWREGQLSGGFFRSDDGGKTWRKVGEDAPREMLQDPRDPDRWIALADDAPYVRVTSDGGATWRSFAEGLPPAVGANDNVSDTHYEALGAGPDFLVLGSRRGSFFRRGVGDASWTRIERQAVNEVYEGEPWYGRVTPGKWQHFGAAMGSVVVDPRRPDRWFFTDWYAIYRTENAGRTWDLSMDGVEVTVLHTLAQDPSDGAVVHLGMADNGYLRSVDGGDRFRTPRICSNMKGLAVSPSRPTRVYGCGDAADGKWRANTVYVSDDRGATWRRAERTGLPDPDKHNINSVAVDPKNPDLVYAAVTGDVAPGGGGVYKSADGGKTWAWKGQGLPENEGFFHHEIWGYRKELAADAAGNLLALSTDSRTLYRWDAAADRWAATNALDGREARVVLADPKTPGRFFLSGQAAGVRRSDDGGKTWRVLRPTGADDLAVDAADPRRLALGAAEGVLLSTDGGATWKPLDDRLPARGEKLVAFAGNRLVVGSGGSGAFWIPLKPSAARPVASRVSAAR